MAEQVRSPRVSNDINNVSTRVTVYVGADEDSGFIKFSSRHVSASIGLESIGPAATIALGLTECCAYLGRGKLYYFAKDFYAKDKNNVGTYPSEYIQLPDLLYIDYVWSDEERDAWLQSPHCQRLDLLSARATLAPSIPTMPITLCYEIENYSTIKFHEGWAKLTMCYSLDGPMYLGSLADLSLHAKYSPGDEDDSPFWIADKQSLSQYQVINGRAAVEKLQDVFQERRRDNLFLYGTIIKQSIAAHRLWVSRGGYTVKSDPHLSGRAIEGVEGTRRRQAAPDLHRQLHELREGEDTWSDDFKSALDGYMSAAGRGVLAVSHFMTDDGIWAAMSKDDRNKVIDIFELEEQLREIEQLPEPGPSADQLSGNNLLEEVVTAV